MADADKIAVRFSPLPLWPGKRTANPKPNPFRPKYGGWNALMPWDDTLSLLKRELAHLGATDIHLEAGFSDTQLRKSDSFPLSNAVAKHHGIILSFKTGDRHLRFVTDRFNHWQVNIRAIAKALEALRLIDRYEVTSDGEQYSGFAQIEATSSAASTVVDLGEALIAKHGGVKAALKATHPDHGGTDEQLMAVTAAREARA